MSTQFFAQYPPAQGTEVHRDKVDLSPLQGVVVAVIGYGTMGRAHALNLQRSGISVLVGAREASPRGELARQEGFAVHQVAEAVAQADVVMLMLPDEAMGQVFAREVAPRLKPGAVIGLAHGFAVAFDQIQIPAGCSCFLAAPKGQGDMLREAHARGGGVPGLLAVTAGSLPETWDLAAAYALATGCLHGGGFITTFEQECVSDQFGEQAVLCGGVIELLKAAFDIMVEAGYGRENAYFECVHELKLITDLVHRHGIDGMRNRISGTAAYGGLTRGPRLIDGGVKDRMREILGEITSGQFATEFLALHDDPQVGTRALARREAEGPLARAGEEMLPRLHPDQQEDPVRPTGENT
jgi:ketol-acid reductoisomerase